MQETILFTQNLEVKFPEGETLVKELNLSVGARDRIGLIGPNGSGKSSLLEIFADQFVGDLEIDGQVTRNGSIHYLPQIDLEKYKTPILLFDYIAEEFENWWDVLTFAQEKLGLANVDENDSMDKLSGGEISKINLAIAFAKEPDLLLLDEPTNHLDHDSIHKLTKLIAAYPKAFVIASHDTHLLNEAVDHIWAVENQTVRNYSGNYADYKAQKENLIAARRKDFEAQKKKLDKVKRSLQKEQVRREKTRKHGENEVTSKAAKDYFQNRAQKNTVRKQQTFADIESRAKEAFSSLLEVQSKKAHFTIASEDYGSRKLLEVQDGNLQIEDEILIKNINFSVNYGDRIQIAGQNGSGKSSFARELVQNMPSVTLTGITYTSSDINGVYLSQKFEIVNPDESVLNNIRNYNHVLSYEETRKLLGNFLFFTDSDIHKRGEELSGGEIARLSMAMITSSKVDLLILDEPTNHLDIDTKEVVVDALKDYAGALIVISHDQGFIDQIDIQKSYEIKGRKLQAV